MSPADERVRAALKTLTPEQKQATDAKRAAFRALAKRVSQMTPEQRAALSRKVNPVSIEGHEYSITNTMLLILQCPTGTIFGGFRQWIRGGRCVRKGQHGAIIWIPTGTSKETDEPSETEIENGGPRFLLATVFDIGQTEPTVCAQDDTDEPEAVTLSA